MYKFSDEKGNPPVRRIEIEMVHVETCNEAGLCNLGHFDKASQRKAFLPSENFSVKKPGTKFTPQMKCQIPLKITF